MKNNKKTKTIIVSVICIALLIFFLYLIFSKPKDFGKFSPERRMENLSITPEIENEITSFFESSPSVQEIENYCKENPIYCEHYCRDKETDFCANFKFERKNTNETGKFNQSR